VGESSFFRFRPRGEAGGGVGFLIGPGKDERATDDGTDGEIGDGGSAETPSMVKLWCWLRGIVYHSVVSRVGD
jgi:hypothetical protein